MKTIAVHNIKHLKQHGYIEVCEVIDGRINEEPNKWKYNKNSKLYWFGFEVYENGEKIGGKSAIPTYVYSTIYKAIQQTDNKLLKWFRINFKYVKVKVKDIDTKQIKDIDDYDLDEMGIWWTHSYEDLKKELGVTNENTHCLIYKLKIV